MDRLIDAAANVARGRLKSAAFKRWRADVLHGFTAAFGKENHLVEQFRGLRFESPATLIERVTTDPPKVVHGKRFLAVPAQEAERRRFRAAITEATGILQTARDRLGKVGSQVLEK